MEPKRHLPEFAYSLFQRFHEDNIPLLLAGGWAVCFHGYSRTTLDIDFICSRTHDSAACSLMVTLGFRKNTDGMASRFKSARDPSIPFVDLIWVDDQTFRIMHETSTLSPPPLSISMIGLRSLVAMKLHALKDGESRHHKDLLDLRHLLAWNRGEIGDDELLMMCHRYATPEALNEIRGLP